MTIRIRDPDEHSQAKPIPDQFEIAIDATVYDALEHGGEDVDLEELEQTMAHYLDKIRDWQEDGVPVRFQDGE